MEILQRIVVAVSVIVILLVSTTRVEARTPHRPIKFPSLPYTDSELNMIANVVNGEVGGITGDVTVIYADGTQVTVDACMLHKIHACVVNNQVSSDLFPSTAKACINDYWSSAYTSTSWRNSQQWKHCRNDVVLALCGVIDVPSNVYAATCDPYFAERYDGYELWAKVKWDTGWTHGTFYYYAYGG